MAGLRPADLLRLVALDAELRGLPRPFVEAIRAGVVALEASESASTQETQTPGSLADVADAFGHPDKVRRGPAIASPAGSPLSTDWDCAVSYIRTSFVTLPSPAVFAGSQRLTVSPPARGLSIGLYVVVADEDPQLLSLMVSTLRDAGYRVFQAYDGRAAYELCLAVTTLDLLITNTRMPGLEGPELIRRVREKLPDLPILYIRNQGQPAGPPPGGLPADVPTLAEPFTDRQLLEAVRQLLARED